jgi:hypothetical protein
MSAYIRQSKMEQSSFNHTNKNIVNITADENHHRQKFSHTLHDIHYLEQCRGCARTIKHDWVFVPTHISKYDYDRRMYYTFCCKECYDDVSWRESYIDERTGNLYVWEPETEKYVVYNVPGKFYP